VSAYGKVFDLLPDWPSMKLDTDLVLASCNDREPRSSLRARSWVTASCSRTRTRFGKHTMIEKRRRPSQAATDYTTDPLQHYEACITSVDPRFCLIVSRQRMCSMTGHQSVVSSPCGCCSFFSAHCRCVRTNRRGLGAAVQLDRSTDMPAQVRRRCPMTDRCTGTRYTNSRALRTAPDRSRRPVSLGV